MATRHRERRGFDYAAFFLGTGMGLVTNLVTANTDRWPVVLRSVAPALGIVIVLSVVGRWLWERRGPVAASPRWTGGDGNPYPGLAAYSPRLAGVFFGRTEESRDLAERLAYQRFVPVLGPSGVGKSSLVMAGLLPRIDNGRDWAVLPVFAPGGAAVRELHAVLGDDRDLVAKLDELRRPRRRILMVIDQLEECVTQQTEAERHRFLTLLEELILACPQLCIVATVRSEFIGYFQQGPGSDLFTDPFMVNAMTPRQLRLVITGPAAETDTTFEEGLIEEIVGETGTGDSLPLLSCFLADLYDHRGGDHHISYREYETAGAVSSVIERRAQAAVRNSRTTLDNCLNALLMFVSFNGSEPTRQLVTARDVDIQRLAVVNSFVDQRLITSDSRAGKTVYSLAHEAFLRQWPPLREHIVAHEQQLHRVTEIAQLAHAWESTGKDPAYLIGGIRLADARKWTDSLVLPTAVQHFLTSSQQAEVADRQRRADSLARRALAVSYSDPELALAQAYAAHTELAPTPLTKYALEATIMPEAVQPWNPLGPLFGITFNANGHLVIGANAVTVWDLDGRLLQMVNGSTGAIAFAADGRFATGPIEGTVKVWHPDGTLLHTVSDWTSVIAFAADGRFATGSHAGTVKLWHPDGSLLRSITGHSDRVAAMAFAPSGRLATSTADGITKVWDPDGNLVHSHAGRLLSPAFGPDGRFATSYHHTASVWSADGRLLLEVIGTKPSFRSVAFAPDGRLAVCTTDDVIKIWDADANPLHTNFGPAKVVAFAPDGRLAAGSDDGSVKVWDPEGRMLLEINGYRTPDAKHTITLVKLPIINDLRSMSFAPGGELVTASDAVRVWSRDGNLLRTIPGEFGTVRAAAFALDGSLVTFYGGGTVSIWDPDNHLRRTFTVGAGSVRTVAFGCQGRLATQSHDVIVKVWSPDGQLLHTLPDSVGPLAVADDNRLATVAFDNNTINIWDPDGQLLHILPDSAGPLIFAPDGRLATASSYDHTIKIWGPDGQLLHTLFGHTDRVVAMAFAADGRLATSSRTIKIWDLEGNLLNTFRHTATVMAFDSGGRLAVGLAGGNVLIRPGPIPEVDLVDHAAAHLTRQLTPQERLDLGLESSR